jgi:1-acyl-sn-glycerol-3-phosphate acyltransferase
LNGEIGRMEKGVALIDRRAHVPVIPAVIVGAFEAWPWNQDFPQTGCVRVRFGPAMNLADMKSEEILATIDRTLRKMFDELREESRMHNGIGRHSRYDHHATANSLS